MVIWVGPHQLGRSPDAAPELPSVVLAHPDNSKAAMAAAERAAATLRGRIIFVSSI